MKMIGSLRRLVAGMTPADVYARAQARDAAFFRAQYAPLEAIAAELPSAYVVVLKQTEAVMDLDADYAVMLLGKTTPSIRVFITEVGTNFMTGAPGHFLVEADPFAMGPGVRKGNMGSIDVLKGDLPTVGLDLTQKVLAKVTPVN